MFFSASVRFKFNLFTLHKEYHPRVYSAMKSHLWNMSTYLLFDLPASDPLTSLPTIIFPHFSLLSPPLHNQACHHYLRVPTCVASTLKRGWFWMMPDTEPSSHWPNRELKPEPSPLCRSRAPTLPSLPCGLLSCCCGVTRPTCHSLLAEWLTHEKEKVWEWKCKRGNGKEGRDLVKKGCLIE